MSGKRAEQAERTRSRILATAERLFAGRGYDATSLQAIADAAGVGKANVYHYFKTKAEILDAALASAAGAVRELLGRASAVPAGEERVRFLLDGYVDLLVSRRHREPWVLGAAESWRERTVRSVIDALTARAAALVFDGPLTPPQRLLVEQLLALRQAVPRLADLDDEQLRRLLRSACDALLGIEGAAPGAGPLGGPPAGGGRIGS